MSTDMEPTYARAGSQRWLQIAVTQHPQLLEDAFESAGVIESGERIDWRCPVHAKGFVEYRDEEALRCLGLQELPVKQISSFWPSRGPVWDGLAVTSKGKLLLIEAKAHIPEAASPGTQAQGASLEKIKAALEESRLHYAPRSSAPWHQRFYQYANRLAFHYFLSVVNGLPTRLIFLDFVNAEDVDGPTSAEEWKGATRLMHAMLGLPAKLDKYGVAHAYVDVRLLTK